MGWLLFMSLIKKILLFVVVLAGQPLLSKALKLQAVVSHNVFYAPQGNGYRPYIELYWQIDPNSILYLKKDGIWSGKVVTQITITQQQKTIVNEQYMLATRPMTDVAALLQQRLTELKRYALDSGEYTLMLNLTDSLQQKDGFQYVQTLSVKASPTSISDIQLVDTLLASTDNANIFYRNGNLQIPLCSPFFDENRNTLHYYAEHYPGSNDDDTGTFQVNISKKEFQQSVYQLSNKHAITAKKVNVLQGSFDISVLPSGNYYLNIIMSGKQENDTPARKSLFFQVLHPHPKAFAATKDSTASTDTTKAKESPVYLNLNKTFLSKYTPEQIRLLLKMLLPIAEPIERTNINEFLNRPDDMYARYFIYNFWLKRNKLAPETEWKNYSEQVKKVNKQFGTSMIRGFESDRGRVYLQYGEPSERIKVESEEGALPYEVWQYNQVKGQANALFLFYRPGFLGSDYLLLHSTFLGEKATKSWRRDLYINGSPITNNSKADQLFGNR